MTPMPRPWVIGLTGGIGTGKSTVLADLVALGAEGINADQIAHEVMAPAGPAYPSVVAAFGRDILAADGTIDRARLGQLVFADPVALARLEAIVHPAVGEEIARRVTATSAPVVVIEAIKLLEAGLHRRLCDEVWVTRCTLRQQIARLRADRDMAETEVRRRLAFQMPARRMVAQADLVIETGGTRAETSLQVITAWVQRQWPLPAPIIRRGTPDDAEHIRVVLNSAMDESDPTALKRARTATRKPAFPKRLPPRSWLTVAQVGNAVVGFQIIEPYAHRIQAMAHVATLASYVIGAFRGQDVAQAMSQATFEAARALGFRKLVIHVRADSPDAQRLYEHLGFKPCGRLAEQALVDGRYGDELLYELFL